MATSVILLADDLTGALDSAAPFAARGMHVRVALGIDAIADAAATAPDVLAINTRSRALPAMAAAEQVKVAWAAMDALSPRVVMKKVDSRLKGAVAAETAALLATCGRSGAIVCPAVPEQGRTVRDGQLTGAGVDLPINVADRFRGMSCVCRDAEDAADLRAIAEAVLADAGHTIAVGARGLANALAELMAGEPVDHCAAAPELPMVVAIGSRDPITVAQVERLRREYPDMEVRATGEASSVSTRDDTAIILLLGARADQADPARVAARLGREAIALAQTIRARTLLCSGGDTAAAAMDALDARQLVPEYELGAGVPVARIEGTGGIRLIAKSGGFGDPDILARIVRDATAALRTVPA